MTVSDIVGHLTTALFEAEDRRTAQRIDKLILEVRDRNEQEIGIHGVIHNGFRLTHSTASQYRGKPVTYHAPARPEHVLEAESILDDLNKVNLDHIKIRQMLVQLLAGLKSAQEIRDTLPESVLDLLPEEVARLPRTQEPGYTLITQAQRREFQQLTKRFDAYAAARLFY